MTTTTLPAALVSTTTQLLTFELAGAFYGLEVERVQEVLRAQKLTRVPLHGAAIAGLINLRGEVVTAVDLRARLSLPARPEGQDAVNIVVRLHGESISLLVDSIADVVELDERSFEPVPDTLDGEVRTLIRGAYKTEGRLLLALDIESTMAGLSAAAPGSAVASAAVTGLARSAARAASLGAAGLPEHSPDAAR